MLTADRTAGLPDLLRRMAAGDISQIPGEKPLGILAPTDVARLVQALTVEAY